MLPRRRAFALNATLLSSKPSASTDVLIFGATPAGLAAAQVVARQGSRAVVVEPSQHIVATEKRQQYPTPQPPKMLYRGRSLDWRQRRNFDFEPHTAFAAFEAWVKKAGHPVLRNTKVLAARSKGGRIPCIRPSDGSDWSAKVFIDASCKGDLMRRAVVSSTYGREARTEYNETLAGSCDAHSRANYTTEYLSNPGIEYTHHGQFSADI